MKVLTPISLARQAFPTLKWGRMHHLIQGKLLATVAKGGGRLMVNTPPQHFKSTLISQVFTSWLLMSDPAFKLMLLSYSHGLAEYHGTKSRDLVTRLGPSLTGTHISPNQKAKDFWMTTR